MSRFLSFAAALAAFTLVACTETTAPPSRSLSPSGASFDNPPPPQLDTAMAAISDQGATSPLIGISYFLNNPGTNGYIKFSKTQVPGVTVSPNAKITFDASGAVSGKGTLAFVLSNGDKATIDLSTDLVSGERGGTYFNGDCSKTCGRIGIISPDFTGHFVVGATSPVIIRGQ